MSWCKKNGFNTRRIKKKCKDTNIHPVYGKCYKVAIEMESRAKITDTIEEKHFKLDNCSKSAPKAKKQAETDGNEATAKVKAEKKGPSAETIKKHAKKALERISPLVVELTATISHPYVEGSPPLKDRAEQALNMLRPVEDVCNAAILAESPAALELTRDDIQKAAKDAQSCLKMLSGITGTVIEAA